MDCWLLVGTRCGRPHVRRVYSSRLRTRATCPYSVLVYVCIWCAQSLPLRVVMFVGRFCLLSIIFCLLPELKNDGFAFAERAARLNRLHLHGPTALHTHMQAFLFQQEQRVAQS